MEDKGIGKRQVNYRLRDWLISRQRYWEFPFLLSIVINAGSSSQGRRFADLLPTDVEFKPGGESPLKTSKTFLNTTCPECGGPAKRETDTMDTFVDSSWYFLRYCDPQNSEAPFAKAKVDYWMNVDQYIGGVEHAILHLMYARFFTKVLKIWVWYPVTNHSKTFDPGYGLKDGSKMSKSKGNVVSPEEIIGKYGADTAGCLSFSPHLPSEIEWSLDQG